MSPRPRFERRLEGMVSNAFARLFKGKVHPAEIARALQREAEEKRVVVGERRVLVPNRYVVALGQSDYQHLAEWERQLTATLADMVQEYVAGEGWSTFGRITITFARKDSLRTGVFSIESGVDADADGAAPSPQSDPNHAGGYAANPGPSSPGGFGGPPGFVPGPSLSPGVPGVPPVAPPMPAVPLPGGPSGGQSGGPTPGPYGAFDGPQNDYGQNAAGAAGGQPGYPPAQPGAAEAGPPTTAWSPPYAPPRVVHVIVVDGPNTRYPLREGSNVVGRGHEAQVRLPDTGVSRAHVDIVVSGPSVVAHDLNSTNGTIINGQRKQAQQLQDGDVLRIGHSVLVYRRETSGTGQP